MHKELEKYAGKCESCGAEILWAWTRAGIRTPVDARGVTGFSLIPDSAGKLQAYDGSLYVSHFSTCPDVDRHRKGR